MPALSDYLRETKDTLARSLARSDREKKVQVAETEKLAVQHGKAVQVASRTGGAALTAPLAAGAVGYLETYFPNKDGSPASLGPVPLSGLAGITLAGLSLAAHNRPIVAEQLAFAAAGNFGLAAGSAARAAGTKQRVKKLAKKRRGKGKGKKKLSPAKAPPTQVGDDGYGYDDEDIPVVAGADDIGHLEDEWSPQERELLGLA